MKPLWMTPWSRCQSRSRRILAREAVRILQSRWRRELGRAVGSGARAHTYTYTHLHANTQSLSLSRSTGRTSTRRTRMRRTCRSEHPLTCAPSSSFCAAGRQSRPRRRHARRGAQARSRRGLAPARARVGPPAPALTAAPLAASPSLTFAV